jgi:hypothetical protein
MSKGRPYVRPFEAIHDHSIEAVFVPRACS